MGFWEYFALMGVVSSDTGPELNPHTRYCSHPHLSVQYWNLRHACPTTDDSLLPLTICAGKGPGLCGCHVVCCLLMPPGWRHVQVHDRHPHRIPAHASVLRAGLCTLEPLCGYSTIQPPCECGSTERHCGRVDFAHARHCLHRRRSRCVHQVRHPVLSWSSSTAAVHLGGIAVL